VILLLLGCAGPGPSRHTEPVPFTETLDPDAIHILAAGSPAPGDPGHPLTELSLGLDPRWSLDLDDDDGIADALRFADGSTVYARSALPPNFDAALERVEADGSLDWSQDAFLGGVPTFLHGLALSPDGDYVVTDPIQARVVSVSEAGDVQWELSFRDDAGNRLPNGIDIATGPDGVARLVVSLLVFETSDLYEGVEVYRLGGRTEVPTLEWAFFGGPGSTDRRWPHGPRFLDDGSVMVSFAALGQVAHLVDGELDWVVPEEPGVLAFPRDVQVLPDGTWLVADGASEVLRIFDPLGRFEVVDAARTPGVFGLSLVTCGDGGGLPCLDG